jgi:quercetin dioxygenase-like cupin family protein
VSDYRASPRPTFDAPTAIPFASVTRHLWGDAESGEVADWIYVSSDRIHQLVFGLPPGGWFRHSNDYRTIFAADIVYYVLAGTLLLSNPATGEVRRIAPGEAGFFRRDTWHHAMNHSQEPLRVLELFAPPPATGSSGAYARTQPLLTDGRYVRDDLLGRWPEAEERERTQATIRVIREADFLWRIEGRDHQTPVAVLVSTVHLTVGRVDLLPGERTDWSRHAGDESLYVIDGALHVRTRGERAGWFELRPGDGFYLPADTDHEYRNLGPDPVRFVFGVAPTYRPTT